MRTVSRTGHRGRRADRWPGSTDCSGWPPGWTAGIVTTRLGFVLVLVWIGGLKSFRYDDEGIVPYVANSPLMSFFYRQPAGEYRRHMNREGELVTANRAWHGRNGTYPFAHALGAVIIALGVMVAAHPWLPRVSAVGSFLVAGMSIVTLSFLVTTPECWVPALGSPEHGFPLLSGSGRLIVKDAIMLGAALVAIAESAKVALANYTPFTCRTTGPGRLPSGLGASRAHHGHRRAERQRVRRGARQRLLETVQGVLAGAEQQGQARGHAQAPLL